MPLFLCVSVFTFTAILAIYDLTKYLRHLKQNQEQDNHKSIKICLTGGPCGGKSQGISCVYNLFKQISAPVFVVPQAATIIGTAGVNLDLSVFTPYQIEVFQIELMKLQYNLEDIVSRVSALLEKIGKKPIILCDRGLLDGKAYAGDENWARMLQKIQLTEDEILNLYDAVLHMVTAAKGAHEYYKFTDGHETQHNQQSDGLKVRKQPPQLARKLDTLIQKAYRNHPHRYLISNQFFVRDFQDKKMVLLAQVYQVLSSIVKVHNLKEYYTDYQKAFKNRKSIDLTFSNDEDDDNPYLIRKRKYKKFLERNAIKALNNPK